MSYHKLPPPRVKHSDNRAITEHCGLHNKVYGALSAVVVALKKWVELQHECPLDEVWRKTKEANWFSDNRAIIAPDRVSDTNMPHTLQDDAGLRRAHYGAVKTIFKLDFLPESWWGTHHSATIVHEAMKHLCGADYEKGSKNLTVGSAFLVAALAMQEAKHRQPRELLAATQSFDGIDRRPYPILPLQDPGTAKETARALYFLLSHVFTEDSKHKGYVNKIEIKERGRKLRFRLDRWTTEVIVAKMAQTKAAQARDEYPYKILPCIYSLHELSVSSREGFGSPGTIRLVKGPGDFAELWISSTVGE